MLFLVAQAMACQEKPYISVEHLKKRLTTQVDSLAGKEMERLQEASLLYKGTVRTYFVNPFVPAVYYAKSYRKYSGYKIVDIQSTRSLLRPYKAIVEYEFDLYRTRLFDGTAVLKEEAEKDENFSLVPKEKYREEKSIYAVIEPPDTPSQYAYYFQEIDGYFVWNGSAGEPYVEPKTPFPGGASPF